MSVIGSPRVDAYEALEQLQNLTPTRSLSDDDDDVHKTSSKTECEFLRHQGWGGGSEVVEQKRRKRITKLEYRRWDIRRRLDNVCKLVLNAGLLQLQKMTVDLDTLLSDLGVTPEDDDNVRFEVHKTMTEYWNEELKFLQGLQEETERSNQSNGEDSQPALPTRTSPSGPIRSTVASKNSERLRARATRGRAGNKKTADRPDRSAGVRKSDRRKKKTASWKHISLQNDNIEPILLLVLNPAPRLLSS